MAKSGQGLPLNLIVLAIIAALVLVVTIAFTVGGAGTTFSKIGKTATAATGDELETVRASCRSACDSSRFGLSSTSEWANSAYCKKATSLDLNGDGSIGTTETGLRCWSAPISTGCSAQVSAVSGVQTVAETQCV
jgi:hypothetical protein